MKKNLRIHIMAYMMAAGFAATLVSCSSTETKQAHTDSETAYNDFRNYVTSVENTASTDSTDWQAASTRSREEYDAKVAAMDQYSQDYDEARRQEIEDLKGRYNTYWDNQLAQYNAQATSVNGGIAADYPIATVATTTAASIRQAYEGLITKIQANKDSYTHADWKAINDYYIALDDRKNAVQSELSDKDKYEIGKAKAKYVALRTAARFDPDVSKAASDVGNAAEKAGQKIDNTAENVGSEVKEGVKTGASKVGNAAEKAGSAVKSTAKDLRNKADQKVDNDPEIR
ncbi:MAG: hypothetical protein ACO1O1_11290 [Adhaeribacter sp.]